MSNLHELPQPAVEVYDAAIAMSGKATAAGGATGFLGFILSSPGIGLLGVMVAFIGVMVGFFFQWKRDKREEREHELRLADLQEALKDKNPR